MEVPDESPRPLTVTLAVLPVVLQLVISPQLVISLVAAFIAYTKPADYQTLAVTSPLFLLLLFAVAAYYLWAGRSWARLLTLVVALLGVIGNLSVVLYYDDTTTVAANVVGLVIAAAIVLLLLAPASRAYYSGSTAAAG